MLERLERAWRVLATAIAFGTFGLAGLVLRLVALPLLHLAFRPPREEARLARLLVHHTCRAFIGWMRLLGILRYQIRGAEKLRRPGLLIIANHPTLIDVIFLLSLVRDADCVVKAALAGNPFTRGPIRAAAYLCNDSGPGLIYDCIASIRKGSSLIIFPEGTRTSPEGGLKLQRGAANIAVRGPCDLTPVIIRCVPLSLTKGQPWWRVPPRRMYFHIEVGDDIAVAPFLALSNGEAALGARRLTQHLHDYFSPENAIHAAT
ncbi:1-acyl-sn-glycerol-3-phosphate acyltransferase [Chitinimonas arctica]|uniref:1-acyl-sn-glycerol-3-phosphate acyltransferase n=1 Tax=Chitinimonas arctica TaxID=2594795 RepID=A0A516SI16_9NEIS|nr:lysophospholipid acyltransferase family protein [Chitinimonas arctica]QDQ27802.1 1-acyl-sn-glycerol-3-phosphate acyltransferase [Chitinimonas arctica]